MVSRSIRNLRNSLIVFGLLRSFHPRISPEMLVNIIPAKSCRIAVANNRSIDVVSLAKTALVSFMSNVLQPIMSS